jgi:hypothetical protein
MTNMSFYVILFSKFSYIYFVARTLEDANIDCAKFFYVELFIIIFFVT